MFNPYANVDWNIYRRIASVSHQHLSHNGTLTQSTFNEIYDSGVKHFAISRYRPSIVTYPFDYTNNKFNFVANPFDSSENLSEIIQNYTVEVNTPNDVIGSPNAEHIYSYLWFNNEWNKWSNVHMNGLGSLYQSGLEPNPTWNNSGSNIRYTKLIDNILQNLQFYDGGGVIINHPCWTNDNKHFDFNVEKFIKDCLDYDNRVLGFDIIEAGSQVRSEYDLTLFDNILTTGRRCFTFGIGDWDRKRGRNIILAEPQASRTAYEHEILRAYRQGRFYVKYANTELMFGNISYDANTDSVDCIAYNCDKLDMVVDGNVSTVTGNNAILTWHLSDASQNGYIRFVGYKNRDNDPDWDYRETDVYKDIIYSQAIQFYVNEYRYNPSYDNPDNVRKNLAKYWFWD